MRTHGLPAERQDLYGHLGGSGQQLHRETAACLLQRRGQGDLITFAVEGTTLKLGDGRSLELISDQWNTITLDLELTEGEASIAANGVTKTIPVDLDLGDYVCYITLNSIRPLYLDALLVTSELDAVTSATEEDKAAAEAVVALIKTIDLCVILPVDQLPVQPLHQRSTACNACRLPLAQQIILYY